MGFTSAAAAGTVLRSPRLTQLFARRRPADRIAADDVAAMWHARIDQVLAEAAIEMVFQPIVVLASDDRAGYEALARFPTAPDERPDVWFAQAATLGLADELELLAVRSALAQLE